MKNLVTYNSKTILGIIGLEEYLDCYEKDTIDKKGTVLIALHDPSNDFHSNDKIEGFDDVIQLKFWDIESEIGGYKPISNKQGKMIYDFIIKNSEKRFLIHCVAGQSRSSGVAVAILTILGLNNEIEDIINHRRYMLNTTVVRSILRNK